MGMNPDREQGLKKYNALRSSQEEEINQYVARRNNLSRKERLRRRKDLQSLFEGGSRFYSQQYTLIAAKNELGYSRVAVSVKRGVGNAAERNYEKRVCREFFRREKQGIKRGYDLLIIVRDKTRNFHESYTLLNNLYSRLVHKTETGEKR